MGWAIRKIASLMTIKLSFEAREEGIFSTLKTKIKSNELLYLYDGVTYSTGLNKSEVVS